MIRTAADPHDDDVKRISVFLTPDAYRFIKDYATRKEIPIGEALVELALNYERIIGGGP